MDDGESMIIRTVWKWAVCPPNGRMPRFPTELFSQLHSLQILFAKPILFFSKISVFGLFLLNFSKALKSVSQHLFKVTEKRRSTDLEPLKFVKCSVGRLGAVPTKHFTT